MHFTYGWINIFNVFILLKSYNHYSRFINLFSFLCKYTFYVNIFFPLAFQQFAMYYFSLNYLSRRPLQFSIVYLRLNLTRPQMCIYINIIYKDKIRYRILKSIYFLSIWCSFYIQVVFSFIFYIILINVTFIIVRIITRNNLFISTWLGSWIIIFIYIYVIVIYFRFIFNYLNTSSIYYFTIY